MKTDFKQLEDTKHMLEWLSDEPFEQIPAAVEAMFIKQSPSTRMLRFEVTSSPDWLTGGRKTGEGTKVILVRSGVAVACRFTLQDDTGSYDLAGIFTWVGTDLDSTPRTTMWIDLDGTLEEFGKDGLLRMRIYELDA